MTMQEDAEALLVENDDGLLDDDDVANERDDSAVVSSAESGAPDETKETTDAGASDDLDDEPIDLDDLDDLSDIEIDDLSDLEDLDEVEDAPSGSTAERLRDNVLEIEDRRVQLHQIREARKRVRMLTPLFGGFGAGLLIGRMSSGSSGLLLTGAILFLLLAAGTAAFGVWLERTMRHDAGAILEQLDDTNRQLDEVLSRAVGD